MSLTTCFIGVIQKYGRKLKWFGQEQTSFEHESEGRLLPVNNADLIGRVVSDRSCHRSLKMDFTPFCIFNPEHGHSLIQLL